MKQMKSVIPVLFFLCFSQACKQPSSKQELKPVKGEFAFLLQYKKRQPSEVGFLSNHITERRLANLLKNDFTTLLSVAKFESPLLINDSTHSVRAVFFNDSLHTQFSAEIIIDAARDAVWVSYKKEDSLYQFSDYSSLSKPSF